METTRKDKNDFSTDGLKKLSWAEEKLKYHKCNFCDLEAKNVYSFILGTVPDDPEAFRHYAFCHKPIYTCNKHELSCLGYTFNGEALDTGEFYQRYLIQTQKYRIDSHF